MLYRRGHFEEETPERLRRWLIAQQKMGRLRPIKGLGQHFLLDPEVMQESITAAQVTTDDTVLEVGPGPGFLTKRLAQVAQRVVAVEVDRSMVGLLAELRRSFPNLSVVEGNILAIAPGELMAEGPYKVVANLPYYITSAAIRHFLEAQHPPSILSLLVQREVAERICAHPGEMSLLALSVQLYAEPTLVLRVPASSFFPPPHVESALLKLVMRTQMIIPPELVSVFFRLAQAGFSDRRKQLHNALRINLRLSSARVEALLDKAKIAGSRRAETLSIAEWHRLAIFYQQQVGAPIDQREMVAER